MTRFILPALALSLAAAAPSAAGDDKTWIRFDAEISTVSSRKKEARETLHVASVSLARIPSSSRTIVLPIPSTRW